MFNLDDITNENNKNHNNKWSYIPDHPYRMLIIGGSRSGNANALLTLVKEQNDIDNVYLYAKDFSDAKHKFLTEKRKNAEMKHLNDPSAFI